MKNLRLSLVAATLATSYSLHAGVATWSGTTSAAWTNSLNWNPDVPVSGDNVIIADATGSGNSMSLTDSRVIGSFLFGATGSRTTTFQITNNVAANSLTFTNGFTANGNAGALATVEFSHVPIIIANDQTWTIGGAAGSASGDAGIRLRERSAGNPVALTLTGTLIKSGPGQLSFVGQNVGNGNIVVNQGSLKLNAGGSTLLTLGGTGSLTVNNGGSLIISRNSGTFNFTKAVVLNNGSTIQFGGGVVATSYPFPVSWNGNVTLSSAVAAAGTENNQLSGAWTGNANITLNNVNAAANIAVYTLSNNISGLSGSINMAANGVRIALGGPAPGNSAIAWAINNAGSTLETVSATDVQLGSLSGSAGTLRNSDTAARPTTVTIGALNTNTTFGGVIADNTAALAVVKTGTGSLTLSGSSTFTGGTVVSNGSLALSGSTASLGSGNVSVLTGATFGGSGSASGNVTVQTGASIQALGGAGAPALALGSLTLGNTATDLTTSTLNVYQSGKITAGALTVNGTNVINITGAAPAVGSYDLIAYSGGIGGSGFAGFQLGTLPFGVVANLQNSGTAVQLKVTAVTIEPGVWSGNVLGQWNLAGGLEFKGATSGNPQPYHDLDVVLFNDSATSFNVNITTAVTPASVSMVNSTPYTFSGTGSIIGSTALGKDGTGSLTILNNESYSGGTYITNGTISIGNGGTNGTLAGAIEDNGGLIFNRSDSLTVAGAISGSGSIEQKGTGVTLVSGANSYTGPTTVTAGTLALGSGTALGDVATGTSVSLGATLDVNSQSLGIEYITAGGAGVGGAGAIVNNGAGDSQNATRFVILTANTTFGGARRWDIRDPAPASNPSGGTGASLAGGGFDLTKVSSNVVAFINVGDTALNNINILGGTLTFSRSTFLGDPTKTISVFPGATLQFHRTSEYLPNVINKLAVLTNGIMAVEANGLTNLFGGLVTLAGSNTFSLPAATGLNLQYSVVGDGSEYVTGGGSLIISSNAVYTRGTTLAGAILQVDGTLGTGANPLQVTAASTICGTGVIADPITLTPGVALTLAPGDGAIGTLTLAGTLVLGNGCQSVFEISKDQGANDSVVGLAGVVYGGTLTLTNIGSTGLAPGDSFKLFNASSYSGGFASIVPATPGLGLIWVTNSLATSGTIGVAVLPNPIPLTALSASSLASSSVNVIFTAPLDPNYAQDPANYTVSTGNQVNSATLLNPTNVLLGLNTPITTDSFTVHVKSVRDLAYVPNVVTTTNIPGAAIGFLQADAILITNGLAFAFGTNSQIKIYSDGADIFGTQDHFEYVWKYMTNDFDVSVRLESLGITDPAAKAGIMAREVTDAASVLFDDRHFMSAGFTADSTRNNDFVQYREASGASAVAPAAPRPGVNYPDNWIRLKRTGPIMQGFSGPNGLDWTPMSAVDSSTNAAGPYADVVRLGLAVTAHNAAATTEAIFSHFGKSAERVTLTIAPTGLGSVAVSWAGSIGSTLQATPSLNTPVTWTNVPGSTTTNLIYLPVGATPSYFRLVP